MSAEHEAALAVQDQLSVMCEALAEAIAVPASRRDGDAVLAIWAEINRLRPRANAARRRLRAHVRSHKSSGTRADHLRQRQFDRDAKAFGKRLLLWKSMDVLVRRHVDPEPVELIQRPIDDDKTSLLSVLHRAFHQLANPNAQTEEADAAGCFADIPMPIQRFDLLLSAAYRALMVLGRTKNVRFIDVGCGGATTVFVARRYFDHCDGLEYDEAYARAGQKMLEITGAHDSTVYHGDGRTFDGYGDYDVIYFYRPMQEDHMLQEMERHMIGTARPGTILIAPYTFALGARAGLDCTILDEPLFITGMTQAEADQLRHDARRTGYEIVRRACDFEFDPGFWSPVLDAASFNGANVA